MKLVFYSIVLNNHQSSVADELWRITNHQYRFVELANLQRSENKGGTRDYNDCPYLVRAWQSEEARQEAMTLACTADVCVFSGVESLPYQKERLRLGKLSFDMSERWLKRGISNVFSPTIFRMLFAYYWGQWRKKPLYKLCCSAFAARDHYLLGTYKGKCYKWGYFTSVVRRDCEVSANSEPNITPLMWCSRYLILKHPELPILMAARLKKKCYHFVLEMYGAGEYEESTKRLAQELRVDDVVRFCGTKANDELIADMRRHEIFLFTSDKNEGWGAVANESMANGCVLVASDAIGSTPYLVKDYITGLCFRSPRTSSSFDCPDIESLNSLCEKVEWLLDNPNERIKIQKQGMTLMQEVWSPQEAARRLLILIDCLQQGKKSVFNDGPCSVA